jgi:FKBP-type peptidyl-prolyl cis-trans isomerase
MSEAKKKSPKSVLDMIMTAIRQQPATPNGVSRAAIAKYLKSEMEWDNASKLKQALKKAVDSGKLEQTGQSFRVKGDPIPEPPPEAEVKMEDTMVGSGAAAERGDTVLVKYEGKLDDDTVFDSAPTFEFTLGAGDVIKGWDIGIAGMKVGGVRKLEVPAKLGYGKRGAAPEIPPNADLFFTVTLKKIK